jgi:hypothetical protein
MQSRATSTDAALSVRTGSKAVVTLHHPLSKVSFCLGRFYRARRQNDFKSSALQGEGALIATRDAIQSPARQESLA